MFPGDVLLLVKSINVSVSWGISFDYHGFLMFRSQARGLESDSLCMSIATFS